MTRRFHQREIDSVARELLTAYPAARIFALHGDLGAGKTTLAKAVARALGVQAEVTSPTFGIVNTYQAGPWTLHHFDFYRIESEAEAIALDLDAYWQPGTYSVLEWPERLHRLLPPDTLHVQLQHALEDPDDVRLLTVIA